MSISTQFTRSLLALLALIVAASVALAQSGAAPATPVINDQKAGSVLIYNLFTSNGNAPNLNNTRISITNTNGGASVKVYLIFVEGSSGSPGDYYICLAPNQTAVFLTSDIDPFVTGYIIAIAVDYSGFPINFNFLVGEEYVKFSSGHRAIFNAEVLAAHFNFKDRNRPQPNGFTVKLNFDGITYDQLPHMLALSNIPSPADGNSTLLVINRIGGDLSWAPGRIAGSIGKLSGVLYNDTGDAFSFIASGGCQLSAILSNNFPVTTPGFTAVIPQSRSGWVKFSATKNVGILGVAINFNLDGGKLSDAFSGGDNLHHLTLTSDSYTISLFPPNC